MKENRKYLIKYKNASCTSNKFVFFADLYYHAWGIEYCCTWGNYIDYGIIAIFFMLFLLEI